MFEAAPEPGKKHVFFCPYQNRPTVSEHIFFWPFRYGTGSSEVSDRDQYLHLLTAEQEGGCDWKPLEDSKQAPRSIRFAAWQYLSHEARNLFPALSPEPAERDGACKILIYPLDSSRGGSYVIQRGRRLWKLRVERLELHLYEYGVGVLLLHVINSDYPDLSDIQKIADYGRRIKVPYLFSEPGECICADSLCLRLNGNNFECYLLDQAKQFSESELGLKDMTESFMKGLVFAPGIKIEDVADDRMFEMELIYHKDLANAIKDRNTLWRENRKLIERIYALTFCDSDAPSCQDHEMRMEILRQALDPRWADYGTMYSATEFSFLCICDGDGFARGVVGPNFIQQYKYMASLALAQRTE